MNKVALSFLAHPDDAELLCAGTLIRLSQAGWQIHIATATAGDCGTMTHSPWDISVIRTGEARQSAAQIGATFHCLYELDGFVVYDKDTLRKVIELFREVQPTLVFAHALHDYMLDHEMASMLARSASFIYGAPNIAGVLRLLPEAAVPHLYYCDPMEGKDPLGREVKPTTLIDISSVMPTKERMLACHASQREWLREHHGMDEYIEAMKRHGRNRATLAGCEYAEAFVQHKGHAYPQDDLLAKLFPRGHQA